MGRCFLTRVRRLLLFLDYELEHDEKPALLGEIPLCRCEKPGPVQPNFCLTNATEFNSKYTDHQYIKYVEFL